MHTKSIALSTFIITTCDQYQFASTVVFP